MNARLPVLLVATIALLACTRRDDDDDQEPVGSAEVAFSEIEGSVPESGLIAEQLSVSVSRTCTGLGLPPISKRTCVDRLLVVARAGERSLQVTRALDAQPTGGVIEMRAGKLASSSVELREPPPSPGASAPSWSAGSKPPSAGAPSDPGELLVEIAADVVTLRFHRLAMIDRLRKSSFRITGAITLDCTAATADTAQCPLVSGDARPSRP
jgi:hypothetical protein